MDGGIPARVISDGRVTIPEEFRDRHDLEPGDRVWVKVEPIPEGRVLKPWVLSDGP